MSQLTPPAEPAQADGGRREHPLPEALAFEDIVQRDDDRPAHGLQHRLHARGATRPGVPVGQLPLQVHHVDVAQPRSRRPQLAVRGAATPGVALDDLDVDAARRLVGDDPTVPAQATPFAPDMEEADTERTFAGHAAASPPR